MLEGVARRRQFSNERFISSFLEPHLGDGQHIPFLFNNVLIYCECLISDRSWGNASHNCWQWFVVPFGFDNLSVSVIKC